MRLCTRPCSPRQYNPTAQAKRNCALPWYDQRQWTGELLKEVWMGLPEEPAIRRCKQSAHPGCNVTEKGKVARPLENIEDDGCPGAWYRGPFMESVLRYRREPTEGGGRVSNPRLDRCDDDLVLDAVALMEQLEDAWQGEHIRRKHQQGQGGSDG